jgi:hypothetical protein
MTLPENCEINVQTARWYAFIPVCFRCREQIPDSEPYLDCEVDGEWMTLCIRCVAWALGEMVQRVEREPKPEPAPARKLRLTKRGEVFPRRICCGRYTDDTHVVNCPHRKGV